MRNPRLPLLLTLLLLASLAVLSGCAPRAGAGEAAEAAGESEIVVDLPAIVIDYDAEGAPSVGGIPLSELSGLIPPETAAQLVLGPEMIAQLQSFGVQNLQVNNQADGLDIMVNGLEMPSLAWDENSLTALADVAALAGQEIPALEQVLPLLTNLGVAAAVRIPAADGAEEAPLIADSSAAADVQAAQDAFLGEVGDPPLINVPIFYAEDGTWSLAGMSQEEWGALTGQPLDALELPPELIAGLAESGISQATIATSPDGVQISLGDTTLPTLSWSDGKLNNLLAVVIGSGGLSDSGVDPEVITGLIDQLLPIIQSTDLQIHAFFP